MLIILSPSKTLDFSLQPKTQHYTIPQFLKEADQLVKVLKKFSHKDLQELMSINYKLADLNVKRFFDWRLPFDPDTAKHAVLAFKGEVYNGLKADEFDENDLLEAQNHLLILSGLFGVLRPLDLILPYRLEMGTKLTNAKGADLYNFWGNKITKSVNLSIGQNNHKFLINLASAEYFRVLDAARIKCKIITPTFKDFSNGEYRFLTVYGKKARGTMARFIIKNRINDIESLKLFDEDGYNFNHTLSKGNDWVFTRG